jgi:hypothetical protein
MVFNRIKGFSSSYRKCALVQADLQERPDNKTRKRIPHIAIIRAKNKLKLHLAVACISDALRVAG